MYLKIVYSENKETNSILEIYHLFKENKIEKALDIILSIMATNCSRKRFFYKFKINLKLIKICNASREINQFVVDGNRK